MGCLSSSIYQLIHCRPIAPPSTTNAVLKDLTGHFTEFVSKQEGEAAAVVAKGMTADERRALRKEKRSASEIAAEKTTTSSLTPPSMLVGINAVTRDIEAGAASTSSVVLACKNDVNPSRLLSHLPVQIAVLNSKHKRSVVLIEMPKGSEEALAVSLNLKRMAVVSLTGEHPLTATILRRLEDVGKYTLTAPWLHGDDLVYIPTKINMVETSMPKDMRKAKEEKKKVQAAKKERINAYKQNQKLKQK